MKIPALNYILQHRVYALLLALASGATTTLAFAPFNFSPLMILAAGILFLLLLEVDTRQAFIIGYAFGIGSFGTGVHWIYVSMSQFGGVPFSLSIFLTCLFILFMSLYPGIAAWCFARFFSKTRHTKLWILVLPALFIFIEWNRGWWLTGFPWLNIGYSQIDSPLRGFIPIVGVYGLSFLTLLCASLLTYCIKQGKQALLPGLGGIAIITITGILLTTIEWTSPSGKPITATLIQGNISQDQKWLISQRKPTVDLYSRLTRENWQSQLIVWPETALPAFYHQAKSYLQRLQAEAIENNTDVLIGLPVMDQTNKRYFNAVVSLGKNPDFYHKQHLVPFGEFIPFRTILGNILRVIDVPLPNFSYSNNKNRLLTIEGHKVGISICYEDAFGEETILALPEADLLVNVSNDAWFGESVAPPQHLQIARMRAAETGRPLLRATNTGVTAFIDHQGKISARLPQFITDVLTATVQPMSGTTPYISWGNWIIVSLLLIILIAAYFLQQKSTPAKQKPENLEHTEVIENEEDSPRN